MCGYAYGNNAAITTKPPETGSYYSITPERTKRYPSAFPYLIRKPYSIVIVVPSILVVRRPEEPACIIGRN